MKTLLAAALLVANSASAKIDYEGQKLKAIDIHLHTGEWETMGPLGKQFILDALPDFIPAFLRGFAVSTLAKFQSAPYGAFIGIDKECRKAGLDSCGIMAVYAPETWGVTANEYIIDALDDRRNKNDDGETLFFGWASLPVDTDPLDLTDLEAALENPKVRGIKLAMIHNNIPLNAPRLAPVYELAKTKSVPIYHHVGSSPLRKLEDFQTDEEKQEYISSYDPANLETAIRDNPDVNFIMGHLGFDFNAEGLDFTQVVFDLAERYDNVWLEFSALGRQTYDPDGQLMTGLLAEIRQRGLVARTVYGSDGPGRPGGITDYLERTLVALKAAGFSVEEVAQVMAQNAERLFGLEGL